VATARGLGSGRLDATSAALAAGEIDCAAARQIARPTAKAPHGAVELIEPHAVETARTGTGRDLAALLARFDNALDPERADRDALGRFDRRGLSAATTLDGSLAGRFLLDDVTGAELLTALDAAGPVSSRRPAQRRATPRRRPRGHRPQPPRLRRCGHPGERAPAPDRHRPPPARPRTGRAAARHWRPVG